MIEGRGRPPEGVGIGYHPFLHRTILARPDRFDFVEVPFEAYVDEAHRALLDPELERIGAIAEARPCVWRSSALSLGSAERHDAEATEAMLRRLVARTDALLVREDLAVRRVDGHDLGLPQPSPLTAAMADLAAGRCDDLASRLPCRFAAGFSLDLLGEACGAVAAGFLRRFTSSTRQSLCLDLGAAAVAAGPEALADLLGAIPAGRVIQVAVTVTGEPAWPVLDAVLAATGARSVVIRRTREMFPLDDIFAAVARARDALGRAAHVPGGSVPAETTAAGLAAIDEDLDATARAQSAFAAHCRAANDGEPVPDAVAAVRERAVWRERVADIHRTQQLARWAERPAIWRV